MKTIDLVGERSRIYHFPGGEKLFFQEAWGLRVSESGMHYLNFDGNNKAIVAPGWLWIEIEAEAWSH